MNRAAEAAVPQAKTLLVNAVKAMSVEDGLRIVRGGDTSVTEFFSRKTREPLTTTFLRSSRAPPRRSRSRRSTTASPAAPPAWAC